MPQPPVVTRKFLLQCAGGLGLTVAMYLMGRMGLAVEARTGIGVVPLWLPSGIALGGFFLLGRLAIPFLWLGSLLISSTVRQGPLAAVFAAGDVLSAWFGWWLLTRVPEFDKEFRRARDVLFFVLYGAAVSTLMSTVIGVTSQAASGILQWTAVPHTFLTWWLGDASGVVVCAPLLLRWNTAWGSQLRNDGRVREAIAAYSIIGLLLLFLIATTGTGIGTIWRVVSWPLLLWAALRFGSFGAPSAVFLLTIGNLMDLLRSLHGGPGDAQRLLWDQWTTTMALSTAGLVVMALEAARKRTNEERENLQLQLAQAQKMESVGRLAGGIAHDFNNLLTVINGYSKLALRRVAGDSPLRAPLGHILKAGERAAGLTQQLLAFSRQQVLNAQVIDLNGVVLGMRPMLEPLMGDNVEIIWDVHDDLLPVWGDPHQLEQVVLNLAVNGRDAMSDDGSLRIGTSLADVGSEPAPKSNGENGRYAVLEVTDSGAGMDEATKQKIFDPFFTTKPTGEGTGLGLSIVLGVVAQSGGHIDVDSMPGCGTTFRIYLPLRAAERIERKEATRTRVHLGKETILVVEDWPEVREYVSDVLRGYGYRVIGVADGAGALKLCDGGNTHFDLVLADVMMPGMSATELVTHLIARKSGVKTLLMSGHSEQHRTQNAIPEEAYFLQKPFSPEELAERVQSVLTGSTSPMKVT
jgi:signal transduction histidine kinase